MAVGPPPEHALALLDRHAAAVVADLELPVKLLAEDSEITHVAGLPTTSTHT